MISNFCKCNYPSAVDVLYTLHRHNVNYFELQLEACKSFGTNLDKDLMIFPFFVAFIAVDICLHFNKPKDAFIIFQGKIYFLFQIHLYFMNKLLVNVL